jgi:alpha-tubulin suppressor-like RCC1 family protein
MAVPKGTFTKVSAGGIHTCGLRPDATVECWGANDHGQATPPAGRFIEVAAGGLHSCGIRDDGTVACWGANDQGQAAPPAF